VAAPGFADWGQWGGHFYSSGPTSASVAKNECVRRFVGPPPGGEGRWGQILNRGGTGTPDPHMEPHLAIMSLFSSYLNKNVLLYETLCSPKIVISRHKNKLS